MRNRKPPSAGILVDLAIYREDPDNLRGLRASALSVPRGVA
ncbi:hypothetical protein SAMN04488563_1289 [Jiangella alkaliphila]|uniref:Uncharacterized protein n=1 Tax=Jiangella alkaliphila TaxID=419479 RepID=A0A1H2HWQ5_9ACTN|nr:hypothetical protein SAMN04488563_1289 [Jiangella alkaliphila]